MSARILSGREAAADVLKKLKAKVVELDPKLVIVQVGNDLASSSYIKQKIKSCELVGLRHEHIRLNAETEWEELRNVIEELNEDTDISGFIVQLPLPPQLQPFLREVIAAIDPQKDIDGFGPLNLGKTFLATESEQLPPATPAGVIELLRFYDIPVSGKHAVVVGRSNIVGKPLAVMLLNRGATVTVCHSKTNDLASFTRQADILCSGVGQPGFITRDMVKPGAVVIDIGVSRDEQGMRGDTDFENLLDVALAITPVPGGVGPMTVASLIRNCVRAAEFQKELLKKKR